MVRLVQETGYDPQNRLGFRFFSFYDSRRLIIILFIEISDEQSLSINFNYLLFYFTWK